MEYLTVVRVDRTSPDDEDAEVTLSSSGREITAFCHPCSYHVGEQVPNDRLHATFVNRLEAAYLDDWPEELKLSRGAERLQRTQRWGYTGCGKVVDVAKGLVEVEGFVIYFGDVPCDGPIEFDFGRLDLWH